MPDRRMRALAMGAAMTAMLATGTAAADEPNDDSRIVTGAASTIDVIGGGRAAEGEYPWMVRLSMGCGGSLLGDRVVLTAAHCVGETGADASIRVSHGSVDLQGPAIREHRSVYVHTSPTYGADGTGDWALVLLERPVADARPLPIVTGGEHDSGPFEIMGWGAGFEGGPQQRYLLKAEVPLVDDVECSKSYGDDLDPETMMCAGLPQGGVDACQGDSGGPMIARTDDGAAVQVGIVSWGYGCARPGFPGVYTQLSGVSSEIRAATEELLRRVA